MYHSEAIVLKQRNPETHMPQMFVIIRTSRCPSTESSMEPYKRTSGILHHSVTYIFKAFMVCTTSHPQRMAYCMHPIRTSIIFKNIANYTQHHKLREYPTYYFLGVYMCAFFLCVHWTGLSMHTYIYTRHTSMCIGVAWISKTEIERVRLGVCAACVQFGDLVHTIRRLEIAINLWTCHRLLPGPANKPKSHQILSIQLPIIHEPHTIVSVMLTKYVTHEVCLGSIY